MVGIIQHLATLELGARSKDSVVDYSVLNKCWRYWVLLVAAKLQVVL
jgi:hypothetical protein